MLQAFVRALAWARVSTWARRLGAGRAWRQGGLSPKAVALQGGWISGSNVGSVSRLDDPCGLWASLARLPIDLAESLPRVQGSSSRVSRPWAGPHRCLSGRHSCLTNKDAVSGRAAGQQYFHYPNHRRPCELHHSSLRSNVLISVHLTKIEFTPTSSA